MQYFNLYSHSNSIPVVCVLGSLAPVVRLWWKIILVASCGYPTPSISTMHTHMHPGFCYNQLVPTKIPRNIPSFGRRSGMVLDFNIFLGEIFGELGSRISKRLSQAYSGQWIYKKKPFPPQQLAKHINTQINPTPVQIMVLYHFKTPKFCNSIKISDLD